MLYPTSAGWFFYVLITILALQIGLLYPAFTRKCEVRCVLELTLLVMQRKFMVGFVKSDLYIKLVF